MKIWYQSVTRNGRFPAYNDVLRRVIDRAKDPDTEVEIQGIERQGGTGDQYRYLAFLQTVEVLENVHRAIEEGFDAFLIGNIGNPGLLEAREIAEFPILGLGETSINVMRTMGEHFGLVTINEKYRPRLDDVIRHADAERRLTG
ncbi:MAG: aspartate/glutamate racemase family protein, partial [Pseudomonadota bacterium]|nr:aspartate/glutamate racemase family protein [Pseudomonadota bacterium]